MRKIIAFILAVMLIASMTIPAYAVTPSYKLDVPQISKIKLDIKIELPDDFWDNWFKDHPIGVPDITIPMETEPEATEPEITELSAPVITEARYYHKGIKRLQIQWNVVDYADSYVVLIAKADGTVITYTVETNILYLKNSECPKMYVDNTSMWESATVRVMAITGDVGSEWSTIEHIGCDKMH